MSMPDMPEELKQELKAITAPKVEVVTREGKPTQIDDYDSFMQFLMLSSIASQAVKIRRYYDDRTSQGWIQNFDNVVASPALPSQEFTLDSPAQSISITNNALVGGPVIWVEINGRFNSRRTLNPRETLNINFETHKLERFFVQCPPGLPPTFSATAKG